MRERLKRFLKQYPVIYCFLRKIYYALRFRRLKEYLVGTRERVGYATSS